MKTFKKIAILAFLLFFTSFFFLYILKIPPLNTQNNTSDQLPKISDSEKLRIIQEVLNKDTLEKAQPNDISLLPKTLQNTVQYVSLNKDFGGKNPVFIEQIIKGRFIKNDTENLVIVEKAALCHAQGSTQSNWAVFDKELNKKLTNTIMFSGAQIRILRGKIRDRIFVFQNDCHQGSCNWEITLVAFSINSGWYNVELFKEVYHDGSSTEYFKQNSLVSVMPPEISDTEIIFPDKKYTWNFDKEAYEKIEIIKPGKK